MAEEEKKQDKEERKGKPKKGETAASASFKVDPAPRPSAAAPPRLLAHYREVVVPRLMKDLGESNPLAVPRIAKVVINMGVGRATENEKRLTEAVETLALISGQKPLVTRAKVSVAGFRLRQGIPIGCKVTLRKHRMYEFLDRLISLALPRVRDFRGLSPAAFDKRGNYTFGVSEQVIFPEVRADKLEFTQGMDITVCTDAGTPERAQALLSAMGFPFRKAALTREDRLTLATTRVGEKAADKKGAKSARGAPAAR